MKTQMKKNKYFFLLITVFISCNNLTQEDIIKNSVKTYITERLDDPQSLEDVSFSKIRKDRYSTSLDTIIDLGIEIKGPFDFKGFEEYVDTLNAVNPDFIDKHLRDLELIKSGKLEYYTLNYKFRLKKNGQKVIREYEFKVDSLGKVLDADDITEEINLIR